jgi:Bacterial tandem repeat domain 1/Papain family cysteine protease
MNTLSPVRAATRPKFIDKREQLASIAKSKRLLAEAGALPLLRPTPVSPPSRPRVFSLEPWQTPIQNQAGRGTCWAFAAAAALEAAYYRKLGHPIKVSEEYIYHVNRAVRIERARLEYPCSIWDGQGNSTVLSSLADDAIPSQDQSHPYVDSRAGIEAIPAALGTSSNVLTMSQKDADDFEFSDLHIPLLARVNARYRVHDWGIIDPSLKTIQDTLLAGFEVVADVPGHCFLIIGYNDDKQAYIVKNSYGESGPIFVSYVNDRRFGNVIAASFIGSVVDPTYVQSHAMWLGKWYGIIGGEEYEIVIRRHHAFGQVGLPCHLGAVRSSTSESPIFGSVSSDGRSAGWAMEPAGASGRKVEVNLQISDGDPYLLEGESDTRSFLQHDRQRVLLSRFRQRYAAVWEPNDGYAWQSFHGVGSEGYQSLFDRLTSEGYRPLAVQGSPVGSGSEMSSVWSKSPSTGWLAFHGQSSDDYQRTFDKCCAEGWRLVDVSGYSESGRSRFASLWEPADGRGWKARHGMDTDDFQAAFDEGVSQGFVVRKVSGYRVGIERRFVAIWEHAPGEAVMVRHGMTREDLDRLSSEYAATGMRSSWLSGYPDTGRAKFSAVWTLHVPDSKYIVDLDGARYQAEFDILGQAGLKPRCISAYGVGI